MIDRKTMFLLFLWLIPAALLGQESFKDTLRITLSQSDSLFIESNLALLAEKCNVEASKAQIIQARLFKNLTFEVNQNMLNTEYRTNGGRKWFDFTDKGETSMQIQKLFLVAGKRNKLIKLAESGAAKEEQLYFDLIRTLKYTLHSQYYNIYFLQQILKVYDAEITSLKKLAQASEIESEKGFISKKELLRIRSMLFSLENEKLGYYTQMISAQTEFNTLMHSVNLFYYPLPDKKALELRIPKDLNLAALTDTALLYRYDLKMARTDLAISDYNLSYQKAQAVPDVTLSGGWDRNGSFIHNYNYVGLQVDLPFFDRNQGNIKAAKFSAEGFKYKLQGAEAQVKADVINAFNTAMETEKLYSGFDTSFMKDVENMNREMISNYEKRNISLVEFLDYYDAFKTNFIQINSLMNSRISAIEAINYSVGKDIMSK